MGACTCDGTGHAQSRFHRRKAGGEPAQSGFHRCKAGGERNAPLLEVLLLEADGFQRGLDGLLLVWAELGGPFLGGGDVAEGVVFLVDVQAVERLCMASLVELP